MYNFVLKMLHVPKVNVLPMYITTLEASKRVIRAIYQITSHLNNMKVGMLNAVKEFICRIIRAR